MGALLGNLEVSFFAGNPEGRERKALGMGISPLGAQLGKLERACLPGTLSYG
jgi:hypothetical protein